jgi:hypothetical protein
MNIAVGQLLTNRLVRPSGRKDLGERVVAPGVREAAQPTEHRERPFSKAVFIAVISSGYVCAALAFYFMFNQIGQH